MVQMHITQEANKKELTKKFHAIPEQDSESGRVKRKGRTHRITN